MNNMTCLDLLGAITGKTSGQPVFLCLCRAQTPLERNTSTWNRVCRLVDSFVDGQPLSDRRPGRGGAGKRSIIPVDLTGEAPAPKHVEVNLMDSSPVRRRFKYLDEAGLDED